MPKKSGRDFAGPAQKYAGQVKVDSGPVPLQRWQRPLTRADHDRVDGPQGTDLRGEANPRTTASPPKTRKGTAYNR